MSGEKSSLSDTNIDTDAYGYHAQGGYSLKELNTKIALAYTYATGDNPETTKNESFDAVFGASDKYYGRLNLFSWSNIKDYELHTIVKPLKGVNFKLEYHRFYAPEPSNKWKSYTIATMKNSHYGDEIDAVLKYKHSQNISLVFGASYFVAGSYIEEASSKNEFITNENGYGLFTQFTYAY